MSQIYKHRFNTNEQTDVRPEYRLNIHPPCVIQLKNPNYQYKVEPETSATPAASVPAVLALLTSLQRSSAAPLPFS